MAMSRNSWRALVASVAEGECLVFLGAGASTAQPGQVGLPTGGTLSTILAKECDYPGADKYDFLRVCQYYELEQDSHALRRSIQKKLSVPGLMPGRLHTLLASLPIPVVFTTNYDRLMEQAFQFAGKSPQVAVHNLRNPAPQTIDSVSKERPLVYKLHGTIDDLESMLCTEDDIVDFLASIILGNPPLLPFIKPMFAKRTILFIGYGLKDWNIRAMIRSLRGKKKEWTRSFALQPLFDKSEIAKAEWNQSVMYWERMENVQVLDMEGINFAEELARWASTWPEEPKDAGTQQG